MHQTKKTTLLLLATLLLSGYVGTAQASTAGAIATPAVEQSPVAKTWSEQEMLDGLESLWWYEEERSLVLFAEGAFHYVELRNVTSLSEALAAIEQPAFQYTVKEFFPAEGKMAVSRTTTTGYAEEYTLAPDGETMEIYFPELEAKFVYVYVGEAGDLSEVLKDKMSGGGAIAVPE